METIELFTSHESLLLNYEESLVRHDEITGKAFAGSAHMLWVGERTRQLDGAHVEFARGIANPIGLKCGPDMKPDELLRLIERLNPSNEPGRLTLIPRLGVSRVADVLPKLIRRIQGESAEPSSSSNNRHIAAAFKGQCELLWYSLGDVTRAWEVLPDGK